MRFMDFPIVSLRARTRNGSSVPSTAQKSANAKTVLSLHSQKHPQTSNSVMPTWEEKWIEEDNRNWTKKHFYRRLPGMSDEDYDIARERCAEPAEFFANPDQLELPYEPPSPVGTLSTLRFAPQSEFVEDEIHEAIRRA